MDEVKKLTIKDIRRMYEEKRRSGETEGRGVPATM